MFRSCLAASAIKAVARGFLECAMIKAGDFVDIRLLWMESQRRGYRREKFKSFIPNKFCSCIFPWVGTLGPVGRKFMIRDQEAGGSNPLAPIKRVIKIQPV